MTQGIAAKQRVEFPKSKESWLLLILLLGMGILPFFLNHAVYFQLKAAVPFGFKGKVLLTEPGRLVIENFKVRQNEFEAVSETLTVNYRPLEILRMQEAHLEIEARGISIKLSPSIFNTLLPEPKFESVNSSLTVTRAKSIFLKFFFARGEKMLVYSGGKLSKQDIHLVVSCYLSPDLLAALPSFVAEHLFLQQGTALRELKFVAQGTWEEPHFSLSSDLVHLEMKSR